MDEDSKYAAKAKWRKLAERLALWIATIGAIAAIIWRFIWPWTITNADLVFIRVSIVGVVCMWSLGFFNKQK